MVDDAAVIFLSFSRSEILFVSEEGYGIKIDLRKLIDESLKPSIIDLPHHLPEFFQMFRRRHDMR